MYVDRQQKLLVGRLGKPNVTMTALKWTQCNNDQINIYQYNLLKKSC